MSESLSLELKELLTELRLRGWTLIRWGPENTPQLMASMFQHPQDCADVFILRSQDQATAYRVPTPDSAGLFNPQAVAYQYHAPPLWTLRAILALPAPTHPQAPFCIQEPAHECFLPERLARPVLIRPLSPSAS
ncbi:hypothetical protein AB0H34_08870 [Saccharopolyspora shandongensis]|uniref:hypothetical protein n=1 Tax=Saccharopolyspora shandongensis TaxID=418495 RepID=UPI0033D0E58D